ncbi:uncharacterized protein K452DRAFT_315837 [Aplosporella prunicola CBS 121167]|uniref:DDHD domain-containing protein n=1 Tax=Aplosporella prunicola CBS 121167 TaxID=1176127 RepID=A0A6A6BPJ5_9PEZI|nr:uncharacterized protein K452DRAFT_315837 [Aplosporella prunicola CBS 121167]KAF2145638.1 hypothetical protein K452DRAFT_315837 [Aplosporella prunicola CBS 121167]
MSRSHANEPQTARQTNEYVREILHAPEPPPPIAARFFYTSPLAIDDPLSPLPPQLTGSAAPSRQPPRPFSVYDNRQLDHAWHDLRRKLWKYNEENGGEKGKGWRSRANSVATRKVLDVPQNRNRGYTIPNRPDARPVRGQPSRAYSSSEGDMRSIRGKKQNNDESGLLVGSLRAIDPADIEISIDRSATTGTPFVRAPSRRKIRPSGLLREDTYDWSDEITSAPSQSSKEPAPPPPKKKSAPVGPSARAPVGISRLHEVVMPGLTMEPIYWSPLNDIAPVIRGTWFYKENMLPVEPDVANLLESGYVSLQPWTDTWRDELNSAIEVGALGEMKIVHELWPERPRPPKQPDRSRPGTRGSDFGILQSSLDEPGLTPEQEREEAVEHAKDMIDISNGTEGPDNKAAGTTNFGRDGRKRIYPNAVVIYADEKEAYILRPNLQPSAYYGRRPLANYIRKGRKIGVQVVRGFDQAIWDKLYPQKVGPTMEKAQEGVSTSQAGAPPYGRMKFDTALSHSERPEVTDLVLVIHGIGQKLSERMESFHFTHAINAFRREVNVELGTDSVKTHLRKDGGGIMVLPVNWRLSLSFEEGGYRDETENPASNQYSLKDITPETLPSVRNIISDVMLDIPYYLSAEHNPKMITACIQEANRIYRLWCKNNPGFADWGRVHIIAHSLGSVMAVDILSRQPSAAAPEWGDPATPEDKLPTNHFLFDTRNLFLCGSPAGFFLLLKKAALLPRHDRRKPDAESNNGPGVAGDEGTYGCLAVENIYNIINPYDPVAYRMNATVDTAYAAALKPAFVPSASTSWLTLANPFRSTNSSGGDGNNVKPGRVTRLPSNVELETHNFTREEIAEERAYALNDNGQIDYFLKYGGGPLDIQYLTMLGAHSSYWLSRDFVRMIVVETGRSFGKEGTVPAMRAVKKTAR